MVTIPSQNTRLQLNLRVPLRPNQTRPREKPHKEGITLESPTLKKKHPCPHCDESFNSKFELNMHTWKKHAQINQPTTPIDTSTVKTITPPTQRTPKTEREIKPQQTQQEELIREYNLAESLKNLGPIVPVIKDKYGNIIDGFHRLEIDPNWPCIVLEWVDTPEKLELARLAVNYVRRNLTPIELTDRITTLIKAGVKPDEIVNITGISKATVYRHIPQGLKNKVKSEAGKAKSLVSRDTTNITIQDSTQDASRIPPEAEYTPMNAPAYTPIEQDEPEAEYVHTVHTVNAVNKQENLPSSTPTTDKPKETLNSETDPLETPETYPQTGITKLAEGYRANAKEDLEIAEETYAKTPTQNNLENLLPKTTLQGTLTKYTYEGYATTENNQVLAYVNDSLKPYEAKQVKITIEEIKQ